MSPFSSTMDLTSRLILLKLGSRKKEKVFGILEDRVIIGLGMPKDKTEEQNEDFDFKDFVANVKRTQEPAGSSGTIPKNGPKKPLNQKRTGGPVAARLREAQNGKRLPMGTRNVINSVGKCSQILLIFFKSNFHHI